MMLRTRLALGIGAIVAVMVAPLWLSLRSMQQLRRDSENIRDVEFQAAVKLGRVRSAVQELDQTKVYLSFFRNEETGELFNRRIDALRAVMDTLSRTDGESADPHLRDLLRTLEEESARANHLAIAGNAALADTVIDRFLKPAIDEISRSVVILEQALQRRTRDRVQKIVQESDQASRTALQILGGAAILAVLIGFWLTQSVSAPIDELDAGMRAVSEGDFGHPLRLAPQRRDEFGRLAASYNSMATQLRELDRLKAEFISVASHELKTPINVVMGYLQLLQENVYGDLNQRQREILTTLNAQTKSLSRLVRQLLDVSRFEAGGGKVDPRTIALPAFLGDLERTFRVLAIQREIGFQVTRGANLPAEVSWDPDRINEVLGNLLSNAFKFTPTNGRVHLDVDREGDRVRMRVHDTGAGIPATELPYVFEKFYQADNQTSGIKGTGLGLAIAKGIVTAHGGTITAESTVGEGTSFTLLLPIRAAAGRLAAMQDLESSAA
jgi:signal transduction histidine kinase